MSADTGLYEQIKTDLGYLQLDRAAEVFATLAEDARTQRWTHIEFLARLLDEQAVHTRDRRLTARLRYARFPFHKTIEDFDFEFLLTTADPDYPQEIEVPLVDGFPAELWRYDVVLLAPLSELR